jgi:hypothetical protein
MNRSSSRRSVFQTSSPSPGTLRRLRSTIRKVQFSDSNRNKKTVTDKNKSDNYQQLSPANNDALQNDNDLDNQAMTPSNIISSISLSDQENNNTVTNQMVISDNSPLISSSEEDECSNVAHGHDINKSKNQKLSKKSVLAFFDELNNDDNYKCKLCGMVGKTLIPYLN